MAVCAGYLREFPVPVPARCRALRNQNQETSWTRGRYVLAEEKYTPGILPSSLPPSADDRTQRDTGDRLSQYSLCHQAARRDRGARSSGRVREGFWLSPHAPPMDLNRPAPRLAWCT